MSDFQKRVREAADSGRLGAEQAEKDAESADTPEDLREALGYWNEMIGIARTKTGELIDRSRSCDPPIPWTEIGSALGISTDAARQRWNYYRDEHQ